MSRRTDPPQSTQALRGLAFMFWNFSNRNPHFLHSYSYVGMMVISLR